MTNANGGTVSVYDENYNRIEWSVGTVSSSVSRAYVINSPQRTIPPTDYYFHSELTYNGASTVSADWRVIVADPPDTVTNPPTADDAGWTNSANAYADDTAYAEPSAFNTPVTYSSFGFSISGTVSQVRVRTDVWTQTAETPGLSVEVTWDGGTTWSAPKHDVNTTTTEDTYWTDVTSDTSWDGTKLNDTNFQVRLTSAKAGPAPGWWRLDYVAVEVTYTPAAAWQVIETWTGTVSAPAEWQLIESWTGTVSALVQWNLIETWAGTVQFPIEWQVIETWTGTVSAPAAWSLIETWTGTITAPAAWHLVET